MDLEKNVNLITTQPTHGLNCLEKKQLQDEFQEDLPDLHLEELVDWIYLRLSDQGYFIQDMMDQLMAVQPEFKPRFKQLIQSAVESVKETCCDEVKMQLTQWLTELEPLPNHELGENSFFEATSTLTQSPSKTS